MATAEAPLVTPPASDNETEVDEWMCALCNQSAISSEKLLAGVVFEEHPILFDDDETPSVFRARHCGFRKEFHVGCIPFFAVDFYNVSWSR